MAKGQQKGNREFKETEEGKGQDNRRGGKSKGWGDRVAANTWIGKEEVETNGSLRRNVLLIDTLCVPKT